ncbi:hypothetical protein AB0B67_46390, partial [Streptomyces spectabilis]
MTSQAFLQRWNEELNANGIGERSVGSHGSEIEPDANTLLSVAEHALLSRDYVNVIVAGKQ